MSTVDPDERTRLQAALREHLPDDDPLFTPATDGTYTFDWGREPGTGAVLLRFGGRIYARDEEAGAAVVNVVDDEGGSLSVSYREGVEVDRRRTGPPDAN